MTIGEANPDKWNSSRSKLVAWENVSGDERPEVIRGTFLFHSKNWKIHTLGVTGACGTGISSDNDARCSRRPRGGPGDGNTTGRSPRSSYLGCDLQVRRRGASRGFAGLAHCAVTFGTLAAGIHGTRAHIWAACVSRREQALAGSRQTVDKRARAKKPPPIPSISFRHPSAPVSQQATVWF